MKKKLKKIMIFTIVLNLLAFSSITSVYSRSILNETNVQVKSEKGNEDNSKNQDVKEINDLEEEIEDEKIILEIEEKISILREKGEVKEEDIKEINLLIEKLSDKDIIEKYEKILSELEEELNKDNNETEEEKDKDNSTIVLESIEKIDTQEKLQEAINSDIEEIVISGEINITSPIEIDRDLKIVGLDENAKLISNINSNKHIITIDNSNVVFKNIILDGNNFSPLVRALSGEKLVLENVTMLNSKSEISGSCINTNIDLDIINSKIEKNNIKGDGTKNFGGAVYSVKGKTVNIINSNFNENNLVGGQGAAIYVKGSLNILESDKETNFKDNKVISLNASNKEERASGAAIYIEGEFNINNTNFVNNFATVSGGAIFLEQSIGNITNSNFNENSTAISGGAVEMYSGNLSIDTSNFNENKVKNPGGYFDLGGHGGAIRAIGENKNSSINITNSNFNGNFTDAYTAAGGAISILNIKDIYIFGGEFKSNDLISNNTTSQGGAISIQKIIGDLKIESVSFENNNATLGGAVYVLYKDAHDEYPGQRPTWEFNNLTFENNTSISGGAIYSHYSDILFKNSVLNNNTGNWYGGGIYSQNSILDIRNSEFNKNNTKYFGGAIYTSQSEMKVNESEFNENNAIEMGGAIYGYYNPFVEVKNSKFTKNTSEKYGGAIYTIYDDITFDNSKFLENKSEYGSALAIDEVHFGKKNILNNTEFNNNYSSRIGTIYANSKNSVDYLNISIDESVEFSSNKIKENRRFINGFSEDKYKGYEGDLTKNIKTISSSLNAYPYEMKDKKDFQKTPFNNIDINILDYEYFISHNNPEGMKGYYDVEVFKETDKGLLKFTDGLILEDKDISLKAYLESWDLSRYDRNEEFVSKDEDDFKINAHDIEVNGKWRIEQKVNVKFNANGGLVNNKEIDVIKIDKGSIVESQEATRDGYKFLGWFKDLDDILPFIFATEINEDLELFAKWEKIEVEKPEEPKEEPDDEKTKPSTPDVEEKEDKEKETIDDKVEKILEENKDSVVVGKIKDRLNTTDHMRYLEGYPDGTIRPEGEITREEVSAVLFRLLDENYREEIRCGGESCPLYDVNDGRWSKKHINTLINGGIIKGDENNKFNPDRPITRAELITMINRLDDFDYKKEKDLEFSDIKGHWAEEAITSGIHKGWVIGFGDDKFRPDEDLTRAEFTVIMNRILNRVPNKESIPENVKEYKDLHVDDWYYYDFVEACNCHEYKENEDGTMDWKGIINSENEM